MKIKILYSLILLCVGSLKSQNLPLDPLLDTDPTEKSKVSVLLYEIDLEEGTFPISLDYNSSGIKVTEVPGVVGVSWALSNIGKITRKLNHLPDEYIAKEVDFYNSPSNPAQKPNANGWFFSKDIDPYSHIGAYFNPDDPSGNGVNLLSTGKYQSKFIDSAPDFFTFKTSSGINSTFFFEKKFVSGNLTTPVPVLLETNENIKILTDFQKFNHGLTNYSDVVFDLSDNKGVNYKFIGGPNKYSIQREGYGFSHQYKDFYLKKIEFKKNNDIVTIDYIENLLVQYNRLRTARYSVSGYLLNDEDYAYSSLSKLEMSEIITPKEKIMFSYLTKNIGGLYVSQDVKQLKEMSVFNNLGEYVTGFDFEYQYFVDGRFILKKIFRFNSNKSERILIRDFEYYPESPNPMNSNNRDVFDYSNEANNSHHGIPYAVRHSTPLVALAPADRSAEQERIIYTGMLRNVKNNLGGITQYSYKLNSDGINYGGGLVISKIEEDFGDGNKKVTSFNYSDLRGFVLPLINYQPYFIEHFQHSNASYVTDQPALLLDTDPIDYNPMFHHSQTQSFGNYFKNVSISTIVKKHNDGIGGDQIMTSYEFIPSYTGLYRKPLLFKKKVSKLLYHNSDDVEGIRIREEERSYDIVSTKIVHASKIKNKSWSHQDLQSSRVEISRSPIYSIIQPLRVINNKNYLNDTEYTFNETKKEFSYLGDSNQEYVLNDLMPKDITLSMNNSFVSKTVYTYLCEMIEANQALEYLTEFRDQNTTLVSSVSKWNFNQEFILKESKFFTYHTDGKIKETFFVYKNRFNNSFYNSTTNPFYAFYNNIDLGGMQIENRIKNSYDSNGKLSSIENFENNTFQSFSRANDKDDYSVNSVIIGNMSNGHTSFYRNSFEGNQDTSNIIASPLAMTGKKVFVGSELQLPYFPSGYEVSFWYYASNKWQLKNLTHAQNGTVLITMPTGATMIDEVWVKPKNSTLNGMTNEPLKGENDIINDNGNVLRNTYDEFDRLIKISDKNNNIIEKTEYNYIAE